jgi:hypothetical protein
MALEIAVGQVWKSKDKRETRYVKIDEVRSPYIYCLPCNAMGKLLERYRGRASRIMIENLPKRFEFWSEKSLY